MFQIFCFVSWRSEEHNGAKRKGCLSNNSALLSFFQNILLMAIISEFQCDNICAGY